MESNEKNQAPAGQSAGKFMMFATWIGLFVMLTLYFGNWEGKQINPNQSPDSFQQGQIRTVILQSNKLHHYMANGSINSFPVTFLLDTGASDVVVPAKLAQKLGLPKGQGNYATTANGEVQVFSSRINYLKLGNIVLRDIEAAINPGMKGEEVLLGMSALKYLEFSQKGDKLELRQRL
ncbi:MAG: TIGR02281 family clan AA aspartic protease [Cellvibrionaceae bacterium]